MANASAPGPGNEGGKPVSFNKGDAARIASVVSKVERGDRKMGPSKLPRAAGGGGSSGFFRVQISEGSVLSCGGSANGTVLVWNGSGYEAGEAITVHDSLFLISSDYGNGQRLWCALMEDSELYEVVMPGSDCSCEEASRERLAGMLFTELKHATEIPSYMLCLVGGCLQLIDITTCTTEGE